MEGLARLGKISPEERREREFGRYLETFSLTSEDLKAPLLDIGADRADFIEYTRSILGNKEAYGVELSPGRISPTAEGIVIADGGKLPFGNGKFELVLVRGLASDFYETKEGIMTAIHEWLRVARSGGRVMFNIPTIEEEARTREAFKRKQLDNLTWMNLRVSKATALFEELKRLKESGFRVDIKETDKTEAVVSIRKP